MEITKKRLTTCMLMSLRENCSDQSMYYRVGSWCRRTCHHHICTCTRRLLHLSKLEYTYHGPACMDCQHMGPASLRHNTTRLGERMHQHIVWYLLTHAGDSRGGSKAFSRVSNVELNLPHHLSYVAALPCKCTQRIVHVKLRVKKVCPITLL